MPPQINNPIPINERGADRRRRRLPKEPAGTSGTMRTNGRITEEMLFDISGVNGINKYDEMRRTDAMVNALWLVTSLPLICADWTIEVGGPNTSDSGAGENANATRIRDFCRTAIFENAVRPFEDMLRESLLHMIWGFVVQERTYYVNEGKVWLKDLALRHPRSILQSSKPWVFDGDDLVAVHQKDIYTHEVANTISSKEVKMLRDTLLILSNEQEGSNVEGMSKLRPCWRPYSAKKTLIQIALIGLERQALGMPVVHMAETFSEKRYRALVKLVTNLRMGEDSGVVLSAGEVLEIMEGKIAADKLLAFIQYMDAEMARAWLAGFLLLGQSGNSGGFAISVDQTDFFMVALEARAKYVAACWKKQVLQPLVEINFGSSAVKWTPNLIGKVRRENSTQIVDMLSKLVVGDNPLMTFGENDEDWMRNKLGFPPRAEKRLPFQRQPLTPPGGVQPTPAGKKTPSPRDRPKSPRQQPK